MPQTTVEVAFELTVGDTPYFRVSNTVKGRLNNTTYKVAGPVWIDVTDQVANVSVSRGKNRELERYSSGQATITLNNENRWFDPLNTASPYAGNIIPRRAVRVTTNGVVQFTGLVEDWNLDYDVSGKSNAVMQCADAFTLLAQQVLTPGTATPQLAGERIDAVLSMPSVAWPLTQRRIDTGSSNLGADVFDPADTALTYLQLVEASEQGQLFMAKNGDVRFVNGAVVPTSAEYNFTRTNIWRNPSLEINATGFQSYGTNGSIARTTSRFFVGSTCLNYTVSTSTTYVTNNALFGSSTTNANISSMSPNTVYTGSVYVFTNVGRYLRCQINYRNAAGSSLSADTTSNDFFIPANTWTRIHVTGTSPANTAAGGVRILQGLAGNKTYATSDYISADAFMLEESPSLGSYFDGDTADTILLRNSWGGTPNASTSTQDVYQNVVYTKFSDNNDGVPYVSATVSYGTELLYNSVTVTSPTAQETWENADSQLKYGITKTDVDTLLANQAAVLSLAQFWVAKYGEPEYRFQDLEVSLDGLTVAQLEDVLSVELGDIVQIRFTPNGIGSPIERFGQVTKIDHSIGVDRHNITFGFGSLQFTYLVLDDAEFGILDQYVLAF